MQQKQKQANNLQATQLCLPPTHVTPTHKSAKIIPTTFFVCLREAINMTVVK